MNRTMQDLADAFKLAEHHAKDCDYPQAALRCIKHARSKDEVINKLFFLQQSLGYSVGVTHNDYRTVKAFREVELRRLCDNGNEEPAGW